MVKAFGGKINNDYGWEVAVFSKIRMFSDGLSFFELTINWDRYFAHHCPRFRFHLVVLNYTIIEANVYYLHHR